MAGLEVARGDSCAVRRLTDQALAVMGPLEDRRGVSRAHTLRGWAALQIRDQGRAAEGFGEAEQLHRELGNAEALVYDIAGAATLHVWAGDLESARRLVAELCGLVGGPLEGMAEQPGWVWVCLLLASAEQRHRSVARPASAVRAMAGRGANWGVALAAPLQPAIDRAWCEVGPTEAEELATVGAEMSVDDIIAEGLGGP